MLIIYPVKRKLKGICLTNGQLTTVNSGLMDRFFLERAIAHDKLCVNKLITTKF